MNTGLSIKKEGQTNKRIRVIAVVDLAFSLLLCQFVVFPRAAMWIKAITLIFLMAIAYMQLEGRLTFTKYSLLIVVYLVFNLYFTVHGVLEGYSTVALRSSTIHLIWPFTYLLFSGYKVSEARLKKLYRLLIYLSCFVLVISTAVILLDYFHISSIMSFLNRIRLGGYSSLSGLPFFRTEHIFFYAFFTPFLLSSMMMGRKEIEKTGVKPVFIRVLAIYAMGLTVLSGMGAVWLSVFIGLVICLFRFGVLRRQRTIILISCILSVGLIFAMVSFVNKGIVFQIVQEIGSRFNQSNLPENEQIRHNQIEAMLDTWKANPFFGKGFGSTVKYFRGSELVEQSDNEMTYYVMLYQRGLIGIFVFFLLAINSVRVMLLRSNTKWIGEPFAIGTICFLIANSFNPYLSNMSTLWILFLPFILGNKYSDSDFE